MVAAKELWLVLDCNYLMHRNWHALGGLAHGGDPTGALFGFLRDWRNLEEFFGTTHTAFAFDVPPLFRSDIYPGYKGNRKVKPEEEAARSLLQRQITMLRDEYLPHELMRQNVLSYHGYEADDAIASACLSNPDKKIVMVSADKDLFQMLGRDAAQCRPSREGGWELYTAKKFRAEWGVPPSDWPEAKAIAGCDTDNITGVIGVGEKTAIKYMLGQMKESSLKSDIDRFVAFTRIKMNRRLVKLPYENCPKAVFRREYPPELRDWNAFCAKFGFKSLMSGSRPAVKPRAGA